MTEHDDDFTLPVQKPPSAPAKRLGRYELLDRLGKGGMGIVSRAPTSFSFSALGQMASLGRRSAVAQVFGFKLSGIVAWWLWRTVYLMKLLGFDRKLRVATDWALDLFLRQDIVQLKTDRTSSIASEHFDKGEELVRQGDFGDKLYVIGSGRVEVCRERPGQEPERLAVLKPGDYFGEAALLEEAPRNATVTALTAVDVLTIGRGDFQTLLVTFPALRAVFEDLARARQRPTESTGEPHGARSPKPEAREARPFSGIYTVKM